MQDLSYKSQTLESVHVEWHFRGNRQSNKINALLKLKPFMFHSLHSLSLANELQKRLERENLTLKTLLQINSAKETTKSGFDPESAYESYLQIQETCPNNKLCGLLSNGADTQDTKIT